MGYRLKVSFRSDGRTYAPGDILPEGIPASDLAYLKRKGFVEPVDIEFPAGDAPGREASGFPGTDAPDGNTDSFPGSDAEDAGMGVSYPDIGTEQGNMKSPGEIQKMRTKDEVYAYAQSIGLDLGDGYKERALKELQESVIEYQEQAGMEALS